MLLGGSDPDAESSLAATYLRDCMLARRRVFVQSVNDYAGKHTHTVIGRPTRIHRYGSDCVVVEFDRLAVHYVQSSATEQRVVRLPQPAIASLNFCDGCYATLRVHHERDHQD